MYMELYSGKANVCLRIRNILQYFPKCNLPVLSTAGAGLTQHHELGHMLCDTNICKCKVRPV